MYKINVNLDTINQNIYLTLNVLSCYNGQMHYAFYCKAITLNKSKCVLYICHISTLTNVKLFRLNYAVYTRVQVLEYDVLNISTADATESTSCLCMQCIMGYWTSLFLLRFRAETVIAHWKVLFLHFRYSEWFLLRTKALIRFSISTPLLFTRM